MVVRLFLSAHLCIFLLFLCVFSYPNVNTMFENIYVQLQCNELFQLEFNELSPAPGPKNNHISYSIYLSDYLHVRIPKISMNQLNIRPDPDPT